MYRSRTGLTVSAQEWSKAVTGQRGGRGRGYLRSLRSYPSLSRPKKPVGDKVDKARS